MLQLQCCFSGNNKAGHVFNPFKYFLPIMPLFTVPVESLELLLRKDFFHTIAANGIAQKPPDFKSI